MTGALTPTPSPAAGILASAQGVAGELTRLTESLNYLQNVCSSLALNQSQAGMDAMVTIAQAQSTLFKTGDALTGMAALLQPLAQFHAEARAQLQRDPSAQPAWLAQALQAAAAAHSPT